MEYKLKPCPFCGYEEVEYRHYITNNEHYFDCEKCDAQVMFLFVFNKDEAFRRWNNRDEHSTK